MSGGVAVVIEAGTMVEMDLTVIGSMGWTVVDIKFRK